MNRTTKNADFPYTTVPQSILKDKRLAEERNDAFLGFLVRVISLPDWWKYSIKGLMSAFNKSKHYIEKQVKKAKEYGYLQIQGKQWFWSEIPYQFFNPVSLQVQPDCSGHILNNDLLNTKDLFSKEKEHTHSSLSSSSSLLLDLVPEESSWEALVEEESQEWERQQIEALIKEEAGEDARSLVASRSASLHLSATRFTAPEEDANCAIASFAERESGDCVLGRGDLVGVKPSPSTIALEGEHLSGVGGGSRNPSTGVLEIDYDILAQKIADTLLAKNVTTKEGKSFEVLDVFSKAWGVVTSLNTSLDTLNHEIKKLDDRDRSNPDRRDGLHSNPSPCLTKSPTQSKAASQVKTRGSEQIAIKKFDWNGYKAFKADLKERRYWEVFEDFVRREYPFSNPLGNVDQWLAVQVGEEGKYKTLWDKFSRDRKIDLKNDDGISGERKANGEKLINGIPFSQLKFIGFTRREVDKLRIINQSLWEGGYNAALIGETVYNMTSSEYLQLQRS